MTTVLESMTLRDQAEAIRLSRKHPTDVFYSLTNPDRILACPPLLFQFHVGEHPDLPVFGRHFKAFTSKDTRGAMPVLRYVWKTLDDFFPSNVAWYYC